MSVLYDVQNGSINSQECKSFEINAVTIKKIYDYEYHHLINSQAYTFYSNTAVYGGE